MPDTGRMKSMHRVARAIVLLLLLGVVSFPVAAAEKGYANAVAKMRKGLHSSNLRDRVLAVWELDGFDSADAARTLSRVVLSRDDRASVISTAIKLLGFLKTDEAVDALIRESKSGGSLRRARVIEALGRIGGPRVVEAVLLAAYDEDPKVRTSAVLALQGLKTGRVELVVSDALKAKYWPVRSAAITVARRRGRDDAIPGLIERLRPGLEDGRLRGDVAVALRELTELRYGTSYESWRRWYVDVKGGELPEPPQGMTAAPQKVRVQFAGIKSVARRVVYVLAVHESMRHEFSRRGKYRVPRDVQAAGGPELKKWEEAKTKLELAQLWLAWSIRRLPPDVRFDVVTYGEGADAAFDELVPATPANREKAVSRIESLSASGRANLYSALKTTFRLVSRDPLDLKSLIEGPETVIFLSDGSCEYGEIEESYAVLEEAARLNIYRQIRFHAVSPGEGDSRVLAEIAGLGPGGMMSSIP